MTVPNAVIVASTGSVVALSFTPADTLTIIAALGVLIAGIGAVIVNIIVALRTGQIVKDVTAVRAISATIEGHVNSAATKAQAIIDSQKVQLDMQRETIAKLEQTAVLLAQASAQATPSTLRQEPL